ncbi:MAG: hypothetical protein JWO67_2247 [Streptosporangiaceae bacterium]|nr:hypothetical protein [Streptosporangiaceae bacterium]
MAEQDVREPETEIAAPAAVPVHVGHDLNTQTQAADFGAWGTYITPAGADQARPILPYDPNRHRATIIVNGAAGNVWVGTAAQCQANPPVGGFLAAGQPGLQTVVENNQALYMIGDGTNSVKVTVLVERWDSPS